MSETTTQTLMCTLTEDERRERAEELAHTCKELQSVRAHKAATMKELNEEIAALQGRIDKLSAVVADGAEPRRVSCSVRYDWAAGVAYMHRDDTGEVVESRPVTAEERQNALELS